MKQLVCAVSLVLASAFAGVECPIHGNTNPYFTGRTTTIDGHLMWEYRCSWGSTLGGHTFLVRQN